MEDDNNLDACNVAVQLPVLKSLQQDPLFQEPEYKIFVDQMNNSLINEPFLSAEAVANDVQKAYQKIVLDQSVSVDDGIKEAAAAAREALKKAQQ
jgi:ABC-type glycerol-3-phosphate transport system substrate-binding protein